MPALVVPMAGNPAFSKMRALAASQAFGNNRPPLRLRSRNRAATDFRSGLFIALCRSRTPEPFLGLAIGVGARDADVLQVPVRQLRESATLGRSRPASL